MVPKSVSLVCKMTGDFDNHNEYENAEMSSLYSEDDNSFDTETSSTIPRPLKPPTTKGLSKSARNRHYAQTSRARHRLYVANLESDRKMLLARLDKLEEENERMRREIADIKGRGSLDASSSTTSTSACSLYPSTNTHPPYNYPTTHPPYDYPTNHTTTTAYHPVYRTDTSALDSQQLHSQLFALSVLDFNFPPQKSTPSTNSPRPTSNTLAVVRNAPKNFLVDVGGGGWRDQMNWKGNLRGNQKSNKKQKKQKKQRDQVRLRLIRLAKLRIYLQLFGNFNKSTSQ